MRIEGYSHFGGRHAESAALKNLLAFAGVVHPETGQPLSEALCFGIAGGIGVGYSFCPSVPRHGIGSGVSVVGRYKIYATDGTWYCDFFDRIGARTEVTETSGKGKAYENLRTALASGRPAVIWSSRGRLPFLGEPRDACDLWMHTLIVYGIDEEKGIAYGADRAPAPVTLTLDQLAEARNGICSHKNRTLTFAAPKALTRETLRSAVLAGLGACAREMLAPRIKTYSLPGLEIWAKRVVNHTSKEGWGCVFADGLLYNALRDVFDSIETAGTGGGLYRGLFAEFLDEAATLLENGELAALAATYCDLGREWTRFAEATLPEAVPAFQRTRELLRLKCRLFEQEGEAAAAEIAGVVDELGRIEAQTRASFPLGPEERRALLAELRERILALHAAESRAAERLQTARS